MVFNTFIWRMLIVAYLFGHTAIKINDGYESNGLCVVVVIDTNHDIKNYLIITMISALWNIAW